MKRVLVTGDAGFIGFHVARQLLAEGCLVFGLDAVTDYYDPELKHARLRKNLGHPNYEHVTGRLEDREVLDELLDRAQPDTVIHLAAQAGVRYSISHPEEYIGSNIIGTHQLIRALERREIGHLLLASTSSVYGGNVNQPFSELEPTDAPMSLYAATKRSMEALAHSNSHLTAMPTTVFRFFTVYGPWGRPDMALYKFVRSILSGEPIDIYGFGRMKRDFTYISDLVSAIVSLADVPPVKGSRVSAADSLSPVAPFRVVNIGGGSPTDLLTFVDSIERALGMNAIKRMLPIQPGDVYETNADATLLSDLCGTIPTTPIDVGVGEFVSWYREYSH